MIAILGKLLNIPVLVRMRFYPMLNRAFLKKKGAILGSNVQLPGQLNLVISGNNDIGIGDNFYFSSGNGVNPIASNLQADVYVEPGATLTIGNNVGMSSTRLWIHESARIGNNVKIGGCVLITDTDAHPMDYMARRSSNEGTKSAPVVIEDDVWVGAHCIILKGVAIGARLHAVLHGVCHCDLVYGTPW